MKKIIKKLTKVFQIQIRIFFVNLEELTPYLKYSKYSRDRNYLTSDERYSTYSNNDKFANIGAGSHFYHKKWINFDFYLNGENLINKNYQPIDLAKIDNLPGKYRLLYCSHVIEHIPSNAIDGTLKILRESMCEMGCLRIVTPDADLIYDAYKRRDLNFFRIFKSKIPKNLPKDWELEFLLLYLVATKKARICNTLTYIELIRNNFLIMDKISFFDFLIQDIESNIEDGSDHVNWFNYKKIRELLLKNGFKDVRKSAFGQSYHAPMQETPLFDGLLPRISLYIEAE